ncbi:MAG TPA: IPT/TIG domain-containing protein [Thermoanaerobaculia bacterium]|nr:IPT/TIG domain-containing protein [Thermoanaerobaculia bacterium]
MGTLRVGLTLTGPDAAAGAKLDTVHHFPLANDRLEAHELKFKVGDDVVATLTGANDAYDAGTKRYAFATVERLSVALKPYNEASEDNRSIVISFKAKHLAFYRQVLKHMTYAEDNLLNFADPPDQNAITSTFASVEKKVNPTDKDWTVTFKEKTNTVTFLATLVKVEKVINDVFKVDLTTKAADFNDPLAAMHVMIAADWSAYYDDLVANAECRNNVKDFILRYVPLSRGKKLLKSAYDLGWTKCQEVKDDNLLTDDERQQNTLKVIRDEIDRFLITANPWGDATNSSAYANTVHIALAALYKTYRATPIGVGREAVASELTWVERQHLYAQIGMANCQEHTNITYLVIGQLLTEKPYAKTLLRCVVRSGYLNIDHAFVTGGEPPAQIVDALARKNSGSRKINTRVKCWDGFAAVPPGGGAGRRGWICDPYLAPGGISDTLEALGNQQRLRQWLDWWGDIVPAPGVAITTVKDADNAATAGHVHIPLVCDVLKPTITKIEPLEGPTAGGTVVTLTGTHFDSRCRLASGDKWATAPTFIDSTKMTATTPAGDAAGLVRAVLFNYDNELEYAHSLPDVFRYHDAPTFVSVKPRFDDVGGAREVTITGTNFVVGKTTVFFHDQEATDVTVSNDTTLTAKTPAHAAGQVAVSITTPGGKIETAGAFDYYDPPTFTAVDRSYGGTDGGKTVTITGTNFVDGLIRVYFGDVRATEVTVVDPTKLTAKTPAHAAGKVTVKVVTGGGIVEKADAFEYYELPTFTDITGKLGGHAGGYSVTITGTNFEEGGVVVYFDDVKATDVTVTDETTLTATTPAHAPGTVTVTVVTRGGRAALDDVYEYQLEPVITSVTPAKAAAGTIVTIIGDNFVFGVKVQFDGTDAKRKFDDSKTLRAQVPEHASGVVTMKVVNPDGLWSSVPFEYE